MHTLWRTSPENRIGNPKENWLQTRKKSWFLGREEEVAAPLFLSLPLRAGTKRRERNEEPNASVCLAAETPNAAFSLSNACMPNSVRREVSAQPHTSGTKRFSFPSYQIRIRKIKTHMWSPWFSRGTFVQHPDPVNQQILILTDRGTLEQLTETTNNRYLMEQRLVRICFSEAQPFNHLGTHIVLPHLRRIDQNFTSIYSICSGSLVSNVQPMEWIKATTKKGLKVIQMKSLGLKL